MTSPSPDDKPLPARAQARLEAWSKQLLDLNLTNALLNFRREGSRGIPILSDNLGALEDALAQDKRITVLGKTDPPRAESDKVGRVATSLTQGDLFTRAVKLERDARYDLEEGGAWTMHLALGLLAWRESDVSTIDHYAPLLLLPVRLELDRSKQRVELLRHDEAPLGNPGLFEALRRDFDLKLDVLESPPLDDHGVDVPAVLQAIRDGILHKPGWRVVNEAHLALFAFQKLLMWRDLRDNGARLFSSGIARLFANKGSGESFPHSSPIEARALDQDPEATGLPLVVDADSSQLAAILASARGTSFVLQGPPGAGKSQTITNIVAAALAADKRVLVVSEKMAALSVVHDRLTKVGLGPYCLELHSHKTRKLDVMRSLEHAWEQANSSAKAMPDALRDAVQGVAALRGELNAYTEALHQPVALGMTYRELASRIRSSALAAAPRIAIDPTWVRLLTSPTWKAALDALDAFVVTARAMGPLTSHPFRRCQPERASAEAEGRLQAAVEAAAAWLAGRSRAREAIEAALGAKCPEQVAEQAGVAALLVEIADQFHPSLAATPDGIHDVRARVVSLVARTGQNDAARSALATRWTDAFYGHLDLEEGVRKWLGSFFLFAWFALFNARRALRTSARRGVPRLPVLAKDFETARTVTADQPTIDAERAALADALAPARAEATAAELAQAIAAADRVRLRARPFGPGVEAAVMAVVCRADAGTRGRVKSAAHALGAHLATLTQTATELFDASALVRDDWRTEGDDAAALLAELVGAWQGREAMHRQLALYAERRRALAGAGLLPVVEAHERGVAALDTLRAATERRVYETLARTAEDAREPLRVFDGPLHHERVGAFREADAKTARTGALHVAEHLRARITPRPEGNDARTEAQFVSREIKKKTRHAPIRDLFARAPALLARLKPCVLMSPLSVAQYLPAEAGLFDVLVFDEASQVTVADAVGAIARAKQVIVVGDSKQMPPSKFFRSRGEASSDLADETPDLESVLDEAGALQMHEMTLRWHYRSRNESLIAFSNAHFYGGKLHTFPSSRRCDSEHGLSLVRLARNTYEGEGKNDEEARAVVAHFVDRLRAFRPGTRSFGIVTFGKAQTDVILDRIDAERRRDPSLEAHWQSREPPFVKNLENVQGDERDEILFSITYGPDTRGSVRQAFGPISGDGGERRLNVAFTRAKERMVVFTSLAPEDIDLARAKTRGAQLLRSFLTFAANAASASVEGEPTSDSFDSEFEREVYDALQAMGHRVHPQVGASGYRIDLGVCDPNAAGRYVLGIECDGAAYHSGATARDRDRLRQTVLEQLGWRLHRIWSTDWSRRRDDELARLQASVVYALQPPTASPSHNEMPLAEVADDEGEFERVDAADLVSEVQPVQAATPFVPELERVFSDNGVEVLVFRHPRARIALPPLDEATLLSVSARRAAADAVLQLLRADGPTHRDQIARALLEHTGSKRLTTKWRDLVDAIVREHRAHIVERGGFLWPVGLDVASYWRVRLPSDHTAADAEQMCDEEIASLHAVVLMGELSLPCDLLFQITTRRLSVGRTTKALVPHLQRGLDCLLRRGVAQRDGDTVRWIGRSSSVDKKTA